jgi:protein-disulfide isomerase
MTKTVLHTPTARSSYCTYAQTYKHYPLTVISKRGQEDDELSNTLYIKAGHLEMEKKKKAIHSDVSD